jgi:hypothetical protein
MNYGTIIKNDENDENVGIAGACAGAGAVFHPQGHLQSRVHSGPY